MPNPGNPPPIKIRLTSVIFKCVIEDKFYDPAVVEAVAVVRAIGIQPLEGKVTGGAQQYGVVAEPAIICRPCFEKMGFKDPSGIVVGGAELPDGLQLSKK